MIDFHTHTAASFDCDAPLATMADAALSAGLSGIAVTDHADLPPYATAEEVWQTVNMSWQAATEVAATYADRLHILRGLELGEPLFDAALAREILSAHPYDFVLGSVHAVRGEEDFYYWDFSKRDIAFELTRYFDEVLETVQFGGFHALAHLTYPLRYMPPELRPTDFSPWKATLDAIFHALVQKNIALEVNTAGLRNGFGATQPDEQLLRQYAACGGQLVTVGSDAHRAEDVGADVAATAANLRQMGFQLLK